MSGPSHTRMGEICESEDREKSSTVILLDGNEEIMDDEVEEDKRDENRQTASSKEIDTMSDYCGQSIAKSRSIGYMICSSRWNREKTKTFKSKH